MRDRFSAWEESMPALKNDKFREYTRYAEYCLNMVASTRDQELRCAQLLDALVSSSKCKWDDQAAKVWLPCANLTPPSAVVSRDGTHSNPFLLMPVLPRVMRGFFSQVAKEQLHNRKAPAIVALAGA
jgi:hypothetical protein